MKIVTYTYARNSLKILLDDVIQDADVTIISRRDAEGDAVVMSLDSYNSLMETLHLTSNPTMPRLWLEPSRKIKLEGRNIIRCMIKFISAILLLFLILFMY